MTRHALAALLAAAALAAAPPTPQQTREAIEARLRGGGTCVLDAGVVLVDRPPALPSRSVLAGSPQGSTLATAAGGPTLGSAAAGLGYTAAADVAGPVRAGEWLYRFKFDWQYEGRVRPALCRVTKADGDAFATDPPGDPEQTCVLRFRQAWPCGSPREGDAAVTLAPPPAGALPAPRPGQLVFVSDGPAVADASRGEHRRVAAVSGATVRLDRPLRQSYGPAVLAAVEAVEGATVRDLTVDARPNGNPVAWSAMFKGHAGLALENVTFAGACDVVASGDVTLTNCAGPALQLNTSRGVRVDRCRFGALYCEEATGDVDCLDCEFGGALRQEDANCVKGDFACERLRFHRCRVVGAGRAQWPPPAAFSLAGREMTLVDCEVTASRGGWSLFSGEGLVVRGFRTDGAFQVSKARGASLAQVRGPYVELVDGGAGDGNVAADCARVKAGAGWQALGCATWSPNP
jgi:hypothetical protein